MARLTLEERLEIVNHYLTTSDGYKNTGRKYGIDPAQVSYLVTKFRLYGTEGLKPRSNYYSPEFKLEVLEYQKENHLSDLETAVYFKIPDRSTVGMWRKKLSNGESLFPAQKKLEYKMKDKRKKTEEQTDLQKLKEELEFLRMENAILKKEQALIQEREKEIQLKKQMLLKN